MRAIRWSLIVAVAVIGITPALADPLNLGPKTWAGYQEYLAKIGSSGRGVFAVAEDGKGYGYSFCEAADGCKPNGKQVALKNCQDNNSGYKCVIMVVDRTPEMEFVGPE